MWLYQVGEWMVSTFEYFFVMHYAEVSLKLNWISISSTESKSLNSLSRFLHGMNRALMTSNSGNLVSTFLPLGWRHPGIVLQFHMLQKNVDSARQGLFLSSSFLLDIFWRRRLLLDIKADFARRWLAFCLRSLQIYTSSQRRSRTPHSCLYPFSHLRPFQIRMFFHSQSYYFKKNNSNNKGIWDLVPSEGQSSLSQRLNSLSVTKAQIT